jgi:hypothetical protein
MLPDDAADHIPMNLQMLSYVKDIKHIGMPPVATYLRSNIATAAYYAAAVAPVASLDAQITKAYTKCYIWTTGRSTDGNAAQQYVQPTIKVVLPARCACVGDLEAVHTTHVQPKKSVAQNMQLHGERGDCGGAQGR